MTTVINTPGNNESSGVGMIVGFVVLLIIVVLFFVYGLPAIQDSQSGNNNGSLDVNVTLPRNDGASQPQQ